MHEEAPRQFDRLATVYDVTRGALAPETVDRMAELLRERKVKSILEVGVGTGRVALPLSRCGFNMTGIDAARNMLARAKEKGVERVLLGSAYALPFHEHTFDIALMVHVLHVLENPRQALAEGCRVSRGGVCAWVRPSTGTDSEGEGDREIWTRVYRAIEGEGYSVARAKGGGPTMERAIVAALPPNELVMVGDRFVTESFSHTLDFVERGGSRHLTHVPREVLRRAVAKVRGEVGARSFTYRKAEALAFWTSVT